MNGTFVLGKEVARDQFDWGEIGWTSRPANTGTRQLAVLDVTLLPGQGHDFHKHPDQEEVIYVLDGEIEQWVEQEKQVLKAGDAVFIQADVVHASFTRGDKPAHLLAILGPSVGEGGYEMVDMSGEAPWKDLR